MTKTKIIQRIIQMLTTTLVYNSGHWGGEPSNASMVSHHLRYIHGHCNKACKCQTIRYAPWRWWRRRRRRRSWPCSEQLETAAPPPLPTPSTTTSSSKLTRLPLSVPWTTTVYKRTLPTTRRNSNCQRRPASMSSYLETMLSNLISPPGIESFHPGTVLYQVRGRPADGDSRSDWCTRSLLARGRCRRATPPPPAVR